MGKKILYVEDNKNTSLAVKTWLELKELTVRTANDYHTALATAQLEQFDLLICDIGLPDGDGRELLKEIKRTQHVKAIALSGFASNEDIERSKEAGFAEHIVKPVDFHTLLELITRLLNA